MKKTILTALLLFAAAAVFAQSEYNFQRRSLFEKLPVTSKDIVFLGKGETERFADQGIVIDNQQERLGYRQGRSIPNEIFPIIALSFPGESRAFC